MKQKNPLQFCSIQPPAQFPLVSLIAIADEKGLIALEMASQRNLIEINGKPGNKLAQLNSTSQAKYLSQSKSDGFLYLATEWLCRYFAGERPSPNELPLVPQGSDFRQQVWKELLLIPYGEVTTYGTIARNIEKKRGRRVAAQAVGSAIGDNPLPIFIPCHRVLPTGGNVAEGVVGQYRGGTAIKEWLLRFEAGLPNRQFPQ